MDIKKFKPIRVKYMNMIAAKIEEIDFLIDELMLYSKLDLNCIVSFMDHYLLERVLYCSQKEY